MSAVDFEQWAAPDLKLTFKGRDYIVPPPTVEASAQILASAALAEVNFGLVPGPIAPEVQAVLDTIGSSHPALSQSVFDQLVADGVPRMTIDRLAVFAAMHWARGPEYAETLARLLWTPREVADESAGGAAPKA